MCIREGCYCTPDLARVPVCRLRHVPLVNRRSAEACRSPGMWPELHVTHCQLKGDARWQSFLRWLAVRASGLHTLDFGNTYPVRISRQGAVL